MICRVKQEENVGSVIRLTIYPNSKVIVINDVFVTKGSLFYEAKPLLRLALLLHYRLAFHTIKNDILRLLARFKYSRYTGNLYYIDVDALPNRWKARILKD